MTTQLDLSARYTRHPDAMESRLRDETVILHLQSGIYFGLDTVGTVVWERRATPLMEYRPPCASVSPVLQRPSNRMLQIL